MLSGLVRAVSFGRAGAAPRAPGAVDIAAAEARVKGAGLTGEQRETLSRLHDDAVRNGYDKEAAHKFVEYVDAIAGAAAPPADAAAAFAAAQARMKGVKGVPNDDKLALYALFKQATVGRCTTAKPNAIIDYVGAAKWTAWSKLADMPPDEARRQYIDLADRISPPAESLPAAAAAAGGASGERLFAEALERAKLMPSRPSQDDQLRMYALFKQARDGACRAPKPSMFDVVGQAKWNAWRRLGDLPKAVAMRDYCVLVDALGAPPFSAVPRPEPEAKDDEPAAESVTDVLRHSDQPTQEYIARRREGAYALAYGAERLAAFDGQRPLDKFCSPYEVLRWRSQKSAAKLAYTHLEDGEREGARMTYAELDRRSRAVAVGLQRSGCAFGGRVMLLYPQNLEFVAAFFGCLYCGAIAVPSYPPHPARLNRLLPRLLGMIDDCKPSVIATTREIKDMAALLVDQIPQLKSIPMIATDELPSSFADQWTVPDVKKDSIAFLQYTSGSTSTPKGVMVTHYNLVYNLEIFRVAGEMDEREIGVSWCPEFHDLGLIAGILCPCYLGFPLYLMSPEMFLQKPSRWVEMMSKYKGTFSGGPNFAYDLTARKTPPAVRARCDLSAWRIAFCGAEPVKISTANGFHAAFPTFPRQTFYPGWGLAEATLIIANTLVGRQPTHMLLNAAALARHDVVEASDQDIVSGNYRSIVCQGCRWLDNDLRVIDPDTLTPLPHDKVGELVVQGPTVGLGYWGRELETREAFDVTLRGLEARGPYLRTGDFGFILPNGEVFICGRMKDVMIVAGTNHYPQDFEATAESCTEVLRKGCGAAFSYDGPQGEELVALLFEVDAGRAKGMDLGRVAAEVAQAIADGHGVTPAVVALIPAQAVCKTSSGKIQRRATKAAFLAGEIEVLAEFRGGGAPRRAAPAAIDPDPSEDDDPVDFHTPLGTPVLSHARDRRSPAARADPVFADAGAADAGAPPLRLTAARFMPPQAARGSEPSPSGPRGRLEAPRTPELGAAPKTPERVSLVRAATPASSPAHSPRRGQYSQRDCAVVGIGCRLPGGVSSPDELWAALRDGRCAVGKVPRGRWPDGHRACEHGAFLDDVRSFDAAYFGMSAEEASLTDPQHRILLEVAQEALDDAALGAPMLRWHGPVGVFVGVSQQEYGRIVADAGQADRAAEVAGVLSPNDKAQAASRIAAQLGFRGPVRSVDTACSSSLVAIHDACAALSRRECHTAVAAGVNLMLTPDLSAAFDIGGFLAPDGRCKTFDAAADGYVRGEGACAVVLKPLDDAVADGDRVYAVVKGSAVNQDGKSNGLTAPNGAAQEACIKAALDAARVQGSQLQYVEAHGTGTALGDPIELKALRGAVGEDTLGPSCRVGSAKTNFGHLESAAGVLGFVKVALCLHHRELPASLHYSAPNPHAPFVDRALQKQRGPWPDPASSLLAGVSSFGFGGTNAHAVLCEAPKRARRPAPPPPTCNTCYVLPVSHPRGGAGLAAARDALVRALSKSDDARALRLCAAAALRRAHHAARVCAVGFTREELLADLRGADPAAAAAPPPGAGEASVAFIFAGQGPQWYGMGRRLLHKYPAFHDAVKTVDDLHAAAQGALGARYPHVPRFSVLDQFLCDEEDSLLRDTYAAQPCIFALQLGLAALLRTFGVRPAAVAGHSLGEVAAAVACGAIPLAEGVRVVYIRSAVMQKATGMGKMAAIQLSEEGEAEEMIAGVGAAGRVVVAARNTPTSVTVSGDAAKVAEVVKEAQARGLWVRPLPVNYAFHSPGMEPLAAELQRELDAAAELAPVEPAVPFYSTAFPGRVSPALDAAYWAQQVQRPVAFGAAVAALAAKGIRDFVEISPHPVLRDSIAAVAPGRGVHHCLHREADEERGVKRCAAALYAAGADVHWEALTGVKARGCGYVRLPRTAWIRSEHWVRDARVLYVSEEAGLDNDWDEDSVEE